MSIHSISLLDVINKFGYEVCNIKCAEFINESNVHLDRVHLFLNHTEQDKQSLIEILKQKDQDYFTFERIWFDDGSWIVKIHGSREYYKVPNVPKYLKEPNFVFLAKP